MRVLCCQACHLNIQMHHINTAEVWVCLCANFVKLGGIMRLREEKKPNVIAALKFLEKYGYITTADGDSEKGIYINVNGYGVIEEEDTYEILDSFCINREKHSNWEENTMAG